MAELYVTPWELGPRCPVCEALVQAENHETPRLITGLGQWPHTFVLKDVPVPGKPTLATIQALCDGASWGPRIQLQTEKLLTALEAVDVGRARQAKSDVTMDILAGL